LAREGKKEQSVVKGGVVAFSCLAASARNLSLTWRTLRKEKNIDYVPSMLHLFPMQTQGFKTLLFFLLLFF